MDLIKVCGILVGLKSNFYCIGEKIRKLPCKHIFHDSCILPWLDSHITCPNCRFNLLEYFSENPDPDY